MVTPVAPQDSLVARELLFRLALLHPEIAIVRAGSAYADNGLVPWAKKYLDITIKTVRRPPSGGACSCRYGRPAGRLSKSVRRRSPGA